MDIFESLENLNVSEECFDEIMGLVEEEMEKKYRSGLKDSTIDSLIQKRKKAWGDAMNKVEQEEKKAGMQPFTAYPNPPKKVKNAIMNQHKAYDKLKKTRDIVDKIRN